MSWAVLRGLAATEVMVSGPSATCIPASGGPAMNPIRALVACSRRCTARQPRHRSGLRRRSGPGPAQLAQWRDIGLPRRRSLSRRGRAVAAGGRGFAFPRSSRCGRGRRSSSTASPAATRASARRPLSRPRPRPRSPAGWFRGRIRTRSSRSCASPSCARGCPQLHITARVPRDTRQRQRRLRYDAPALKAAAHAWSRNGAGPPC